MGAAFIFSAISMFAAGKGSDKATIIVDYFYVSNHVRNYDYRGVDMLRNDIIKELMSTGRVIVVGAAPGVKFDVCITRDIAGHSVSDKIGVIKISEVEGTDISYATVKKGGAEILSAMRSGAKLTIKSSKAGFWD